MSYVIYEVDKDNTGKINTLLKDDIVGRQTIITREATSLDIKSDVTYVKVEGSPEGLKRAEELVKDLGFKKLDDKHAKEINTKIEKQEDSAATGMGMIFD